MKGDTGKPHAWLACVVFLAAAVSGQPQTAAPPLPDSTSLVPLTSRKSPVAMFRELLATNSVGWQAYLSNRPPEIQKQIRAKLREYLSLNPDERELRLQVTELRYYLWPLMNHAPSERTDYLAGLPENIRPLVESRLREWDILPPDSQKALLQNGVTLRWMTEMSVTNSSLSPERRKLLERGAQQLQAMSETDRQRTFGLFRSFFDLTPAEKDKVLRSVSDAERAQMERTLGAFAKLTPEQRASCLKSFERFATFSVAERQQFLRNAEKWKLMTPAERQSWRNLVNQAPGLPPLPPGAGGPPLPPRMRLSRPAAPMATNGN